MRPIRLDTPRNLYASGHRLAAHCPACDRWQELTAIGLARIGALDTNIMELRLRCREMRGARREAGQAAGARGGAGA
jgi:hypothetical protein